MQSKIKYFILIGSLLFIQPIYARSCNIQPETKKQIVNLLCGNKSRNEVYSFNGSDCHIKSTENRLLDTVNSVIAFRLCGMNDFADKVSDASYEAMKPVEVLAPCVGSDVDVKAIYAEMERKALKQDLFQGKKCEGDLKAMITERAKQLAPEVALNAILDENKFYKMLHVQIAPNGDVIDFKE